MIKTQAGAVKGKLLRTPNSELRTLTFETPIQYLKGVGPKRAELFKRLNLATLRDLLYHFPRRHEDRRQFLSIAQVTPGQKVTVRGTIAGSSMFRAKTGTVILQVVVRDAPGGVSGEASSSRSHDRGGGSGEASSSRSHATGTIAAMWFNQPYMRRWFPVGEEIILYGLAEKTGKRFTMMAPEFELIPKGESATHRSLHMGRVVPVYPATSGLHQRELREAAAAALRALLPSIADPFPREMLERHHLPHVRVALRDIHFPAKPEAVHPAQERLAFDELLCFQAALFLRRMHLAKRPGISHVVGGDLVNRFREGLPFRLTGGQEKAIEEISRDMAASQPMRRLVQGEVGSGKTVVAAYAALVAAQSGCQTAVMCPTEVLARQHALTLTRLLSSIDLQVALITSETVGSRQEVARDLKEGRVSVIVGTHALLEPWVGFKRLGLVIIDEQQKFGVDQRSTLEAKGENPDLLILTATPIPRTLALTLYGEMDVSVIAERPAGRKAVKTIWMDSTRRDAVAEFIKKELDSGGQAYVVCPRIEKETDQLFGLSSANDMFEIYRRAFSDYKVGLLHGQMPPAQRQKVFAAFRRAEIQILVATQIIEVGVDQPSATVMVIEGADRFGLSQLHQLRGRVGRGERESTCILMADPKSSATVERLEAVVETEDAFAIAEKDLQLRGPGQLLGKRQAGLPDLKCLAWASQGPWLEIAREEAQQILSSNMPKHQPFLAFLKREVRLRFPQLMEGCG